MRCIREIIQYWAIIHGWNIVKDEFDVRQKKQLPDTSYDIYISSGGPGSPLDTRFEDWDIAGENGLIPFTAGIKILIRHKRNLFYLSVILFNWLAGISMPGWFVKEGLKLLVYSRFTCWKQEEMNRYLQD